MMRETYVESMTMNLPESVNYSVKYTLFKAKMEITEILGLRLKHTVRNLISVPFAHYDGADNFT